MYLEELRSVINIVLTNKNKPFVNELHDSTSLRNDLGFDSLDLAELTVRIDAIYGIDIFEDGVVESVGEIILKLEKLK